MKEAACRASGTVKKAAGNKGAFRSYGWNNQGKEGAPEKPNCWASVRLTRGGVGTETALIGKGVGGKGTGRIAGLEWARPGEEAQRSQRLREPVLRAPTSTVTGGNIGVTKLREESTDSFLFCIL